MFDELRGLDFDVSCANLEISIFSEAKQHSRTVSVRIPPLDLSRVRL